VGREGEEIRKRWGKEREERRYVKFKVS